MLQIIFAGLALAVSLVAAELPVRTVYQFASNDTWLENIATRSNGLILATEIGPPASLLQFDPTQKDPQPTTIMTFDTVLGLSGIAEGAHDVFYVTGANTTADNIEDPPTNATHVWQVDFNSLDHNGKPKITLICRPEAPTGFNGMAAYNETIILATATYQDAIFAIDVTTGYTWEAMKQDTMTQINGIKFQDGYVYWAASGDFVRAPVYEDITAGTGEIIASFSAIDDFAIAPVGYRTKKTHSADRKYAYAATAGYNSILQISWNGNNATGFDNKTAIIAGSEYSTEIAEPTGGFFGRGPGQWNKLYVTTGGGSGEAVDVDGVETAVGAQLLEIQLD